MIFFSLIAKVLIHALAVFPRVFSTSTPAGNMMFLICF